MQEHHKASVTLEDFVEGLPRASWGQRATLPLVGASTCTQHRASSFSSAATFNPPGSLTRFVLLYFPLLQMRKTRLSQVVTCPVTQLVHNGARM